MTRLEEGIDFSDCTYSIAILRKSTSATLILFGANYCSAACRNRCYFLGWAGPLGVSVSFSCFCMSTVVVVAAAAAAAAAFL